MGPVQERGGAREQREDERRRKRGGREAVSTHKGGPGPDMK